MTTLTKHNNNNNSNNNNNNNEQQQKQAILLKRQQQRRKRKTELNNSPVSSNHHHQLRSMSLNEIVCDLVSRFILNCPEEEYASLDRLFFQIEEAHWFYEDFYREHNPILPEMSFKSFVDLVFESFPVLNSKRRAVEDHVQSFYRYKQTVPVCGAIILNQSKDKVLLVKGWNSKCLSFPRGKINQDEKELVCAAREVREEIGFDITRYLRQNDFLSTHFNEQSVKLFIVVDIPENVRFAAQTRKEIRSIEWHSIETILGLKASNSPVQQQQHPYVFVMDLVLKLAKWLCKRYPALLKDKLQPHISSCDEKNKGKKNHSKVVGANNNKKNGNGSNNNNNKKKKKREIVGDINFMMNEGLTSDEASPQTPTPVQNSADAIFTEKLHQTNKSKNQQRKSEVKNNSEVKRIMQKTAVPSSPVKNNAVIEVAHTIQNHAEKQHTSDPIAITVVNKEKQQSQQNMHFMSQSLPAPHVSSTPMQRHLMQPQQPQSYVPSQQLYQLLGVGSNEHSPASPMYPHQPFFSAPYFAQPQPHLHHYPLMYHPAPNSLPGQGHFYS